MIDNLITENNNLITENNNIIMNEDEFNLINDSFGNNLYNYDTLKIFFNENYTVKQLQKVANYYNINTRKALKNEIIELIVLFELEESNYEKVKNRKKLWFYMDELKNDPYLKKFIFFE